MIHVRAQSRRRGLGLIELLTIVAVLIVALALVVATARHVRSNSANELTRKRLQALVDETARLIVRDDLDPTLPIPASLDAAAARLGNPAAAAIGPADPAAPAGPPTEPVANLNAVEAALRAFAGESADRLRGLLAAAAASPDPPPTGDADAPAPGRRAEILRKAQALQSAAGLTGVAELRDAWGRPIALMPRQLPALGIAPDDGPFFVSAGPDGSFLTLADNLYSYDLPALLPAPRRSGRRPGGAIGPPASASPASARPADAGHDE